MEINDISWIGQSCFIFDSNKTRVIIDPFNIPNIKKKADLLLITHPHPDHYSPKDIERVVSKNTHIIYSGNCDGIEKFGKTVMAKPGYFEEFDDIKISAIPAYNTNAERLKYHPRSNKWVGYVIEIGGIKIYHAGDTDKILEMEGLENIDIAMIPAGGTYTMGIDEAIEAAKSIDAKRIMPMHYKMLIGQEKSKELEEKFKRSIRNAHIMNEVVPE